MFCRYVFLGLVSLFISSSIGRASTIVNTPTPTFNTAMTNASALENVSYTINFASGATSPITISQAPASLTFLRSLTVLNTSGHSITLQGGSANTFSLISAPSSSTQLQLNNLTISSFYGGAISGNGPITTTDMIFSNNSSSGQGGGAIEGIGTMTLNDSTFSGNSSSTAGGAICGSRPITITGSDFSGNSAPTGGAVFTQGNLSLTDTTFSGNSSTSSGGGAIYIQISGQVTFTTNTPNILNPSSGNTSGDNDIACYDNTSQFIKAGTSTLTLNTINNGWQGSTLVNQGALIVGDSTHSTATWGNASAPLTVSSGATVGGYGTINASTATLGSGSTFLAGLIAGQTNTPPIVASGAFTITGANLLVQPSSSSLLNNSTYTIATGSSFTGTFGSVTIDPSTGFQSLYSIANTLYNSTSVQVTIQRLLSSTVVNSSLPGTGLTTFDEAVTYANATGSAYTINFASLNAPLTITSAPAQLSTTLTSLDVNNAGNPLVTLTGGGSSNPFPLLATSSTPGSAPTLSLENVLVNFFCNSSGSGGAIYSINNISVTDATFISNSTTGNSNGGAIYAEAGANVSLAGTTTFSYNSSRNGGAINVNGGNINSSGIAIFTNNSSSSDGNGGAINIPAGTLTLSGTSIFTGNTSPNQGGAIYVGYGSEVATVNLSGPSTFISNSASTSGGAIFAGSAAPINVSSTATFMNNTATSGGAIYGNGGQITLSGPTTFTSNTASQYGGAINTAGILNTTGPTTFTSNTAVSGGGAISIGSSACNLSGAIFTSNGSTTNGGAIYTNGGAINFLAPTTFTSNSATQYGGAIYGLGDISLSGTATFTTNSASNGGAIYTNGGAINLSGPTMITFTGNSTTQEGGALYGASVNLSGPTTFTSNTSTGGSGGAINTPGSLSVTAPATFNSNSATSSGGAISIGSASCSLSGATFTSNSSANNGGAIFSNGGAINLSGTTTFTSNTAPAGGAINTTGPINLSGTTTFSSNVATQYGGAVYARGDLTLSGTTTFTDNSALLGGGVYTTGNLTLLGMQFTNNTASSGGGAVFMNDAGTTLTYNTPQPTNLNPGNGSSIGDNDIACYNNTSQFIKAGTSTLTLNTINNGWQGSTLVNAGSMIVGDSSHLTATWGNAAGGNIEVQQGATLGGYGTISASNITFDKGSTWMAGITPSGQSGLLAVSNTLTLNPATLQITPASGTYNSDGQTYTLATYQTLQGAGNLTVSIDSAQGQQGLSEIGSVSYGPGSITITVVPTTTLPSTSALDLNDTVIDTAMANGTTAVPSSFSPGTIDDDFVAKFTFASLQPWKDRQQSVLSLLAQPKSDPLSTLLQVAASRGPLVVNWNQYRLWVSPYYSQGKTKAHPGQSMINDFHEGLLIGAEKRSLSRNWTIGVLTGAGMGYATLPQSVNTGTRDKSLFVGVYHSLGFLEHARYDVVLNANFTENKGERSGMSDSNTSYLALSTFKSRTYSANFETSYQFKFKEHSSFRPNLGFTLAQNTQDPYTERNVSSTVAQSWAKYRATTQEIYAGIGLRHSWKYKQYDFKLTGVVEHGYDMANETINQTLFVQNGPTQGFQVTQPGQGRNTNYVTVYGSVLNNNNKLKFLASYNGSFQEHRTVHTFTLKAEMRF